jgi:hypothetical protein
MWHGRAECLSRQPSMQLCWESSSFVFELVGVWWTSENGDECGIKPSSTLDVGFICKYVLPAQRPVLFRKVRTPFIPGNNIYDTYPTGTWPDTKILRNVSEERISLLNILPSLYPFQDTYSLSLNITCNLTCSVIVFRTGYRTWHHIVNQVAMLCVVTQLTWILLTRVLILSDNYRLSLVSLLRHACGRNDGWAKLIR